MGREAASWDWLYLLHREAGMSMENICARVLGLATGSLEVWLALSAGAVYGELRPTRCFESHTIDTDRLPVPDILSLAV